MKIKQGIKWNFYKAVGNFLIKFIYGVVVAKLLGPTIIGQLGMIVAFSGFASILINSGFKSRIIQVDKITNEELNTIFIFNIIIGLFLTITFYIFSNIIAAFFNFPELGVYIKIYSLNFTLQSAILVPLSFNDRNLDFKKNTNAILFANLFALIVATCMILLKYELMSLIIYSLSANLFSIIFVYWNSGWKPSYGFDLHLLKQHLPYSLNLLFVRFFEEIIAKIDNVVTGKYFDARTLGLFSKSNDIASLPNSLITSAVNNTLFPYFSRIQTNELGTKHTYYQLLFVISFFYINVFLTLIYFSKEIVLIILNESWLPMLPYFRYALIIMMIKGISSFKGYFILSKGNSRTLANSLYLSGLIKIFLIFVLLLNYSRFTPMIFLVSTLISELILFFSYERKIINLFHMKIQESIFFIIKNSIFQLLLFLVLNLINSYFLLNFLAKFGLYVVFNLMFLLLSFYTSLDFRNCVKLLINFKY